MDISVYILYLLSFLPPLFRLEKRLNVYYNIIYDEKSISVYTILNTFIICIHLYDVSV